MSASRSKESATTHFLRKKAESCASKALQFQVAIQIPPHQGGGRNSGAPALASVDSAGGVGGLWLRRWSSGSRSWTRGALGGRPRDAGVGSSSSLRRLSRVVGRRVDVCTQVVRRSASCVRTSSHRQASVVGVGLASGAASGGPSTAPHGIAPSPSEQGVTPATPHWRRASSTRAWSCTRPVSRRCCPRGRR